jgi:hypothetical protein
MRRNLLAFLAGALIALAAALIARSPGGGTDPAGATAAAGDARRVGRAALRRRPAGPRQWCSPLRVAGLYQCWYGARHERPPRGTRRRKHDP